MQLCEDCGANPATVHLTRIVNETTLVSHLCEECSRKKPSAFQSPTMAHARGGTGKRHRLSAMSIKTFGIQTKGWLGCSECYRHFEKDIDSLLMQVHGSTVHKGKVYRHSGPDKLDIKDMERLKSELSEAIEKEEFELAALIRDTLHSFNTKTPEKPGPGPMTERSAPFAVPKWFSGPDPTRTWSFPRASGLRVTAPATGSRQVLAVRAKAGF